MNREKLQEFVRAFVLLADLVCWLIWAFYLR